MKISLGRGHAPTVGNGTFSHKIDYIAIFKKILNLQRHYNGISVSRVAAILLNNWISPIGQSGEAR